MSAKMSKTERRKLFQPIPLSSILDPTYQSPFSKLENFRVDMDITSKSFPQPTVWQKLQSSLLSAMSNFVIMSATSVTAMSNRSSHLVPWKSFRPCELVLSEDVADSRPTSQTLTGSSAPEKSASLYHSVRSGLECLRYFATHRVQPDDFDERKPNIQTQTPTRHYYDCRKQNNIVGYPIGGGALFFPLISTADSTPRYSLSAPTSPCHRQTLRPVVSNLFSWAMSGFLVGIPLDQRHMNALFSNHCLFSPVHAKGAEINTTMLCPERSAGNLEITSSSCKTTAEGKFEIFFQSSSAASQDNKSEKNKPINCSSSASSPSKPIPMANSPAKTNSSGVANSGCIRIETNWGPLHDESSSRTNFHTVSVCSNSSAIKGGTFSFSCSSSMSASPRRSMMSSARTAARRPKTESESSTDSFVEFSASVESTDSFCIVFESADGCIGEHDVNREDDEDDDEWEDDEDEENDTEDDDEDQIFNYSSTSDDIFVDGYIFQADGIDAVPTSCDQVDRCADSTIPKRHKTKTVSFDEEHLESVLEFEDDSESKSCRETYWEMLARDHARFEDRVQRTGDILEPILQPFHRQKIFQQRFMDVGENQLN